MIHQTEGIVFKLTPYGESGVVVQIFTKKWGLQSYLIHGVRKAKARIPLSALQPLHLLEMVVYHKNTGGLQRVNELKHQPAFSSIPFDIQKTSMVLFLHEILCKTIHHDFQDEYLFDYLYHALLWLDVKDKVSPNFHLSFLLKLTKYLGFMPSFDRINASVCFDLVDGKYQSVEPIHSHYLSMEDAYWCEKLFFNDFDQIIFPELNQQKRRSILRKILEYYHLHINSVRQLKSLDVLEQLFS